MLVYFFRLVDVCHRQRRTSKRLYGYCTKFQQRRLQPLYLVLNALDAVMADILDAAIKKAFLPDLHQTLTGNDIYAEIPPQKPIPENQQAEYEPAQHQPPRPYRQRPNIERYRAHSKNTQSINHAVPHNYRVLSEYEIYGFIFVLPVERFGHGYSIEYLVLSINGERGIEYGSWNVEVGIWRPELESWKIGVGNVYYEKTGDEHE